MSAVSVPHPSLRAQSLAECGSLIALALPLVAGLAASTMMMLVDTAMLGPLGPVPLAAVSLTTSFLIIVYAALYGFLGPVAILVGQAHGAKDDAAVARIVLHGYGLAAAVGAAGAALLALVLFALPWFGQPPAVLAVIGPYWLWMAASLVPFCISLVFKNWFDAIDRPWVGVGFMGLTLAFKALLNQALIGGDFGAPALGLTGAGVASFFATALGLAAMAIYAYAAPSMRRYRTPQRLARAGFAAQLREGVPMGVQYFLEGGAVALASVMIGWLGAVALAANQIAFSFGALLYMLPLGMAAAVSIRVAQAVGEGAGMRVGPIGLAALGLVTLWTVAFSLVLVLEGARIAAWFVDDAAVIAVTAGIFFTFGLMQVFDGVQSVALGALRGMLDNRWPTNVSLIAYWLVALPAAYLIGFPLGFGAAGVWFGFGLGLMVAAAMLIWRFRRKSGLALRTRAGRSRTTVKNDGNA
jgi:MATE family multidrug resistance protein